MPKSDTLISLGGLILLLAVFLPFIQAGRRKATLELVERELSIERDAREEQEKRHKASEARCQAELARLSGRLDLVTQDFARIIAQELVSVMRAEGVIPRKE